MAKKDTMREGVRLLRNVNEMAKILTGSGISDIGKRWLNIYGDELKTSAKKKFIDLVEEVGEDGLPLNSPYRVLHCRPDYEDMVIKGRYRLLVKELHPDTGTNPDSKEYQRVVEAYKAVMAERALRKEAKDGTGKEL